MLGIPWPRGGRLADLELVGRFQGHALRLYTGRRATRDAQSPSVLVYALRLPGRPYSQPAVLLSDLKQELQRGALAAEVQSALSHLSQLGTVELGVEDGYLVLTRPPSAYALGHRSLSETFAALARLVPLFARGELEVQLSPRDGDPVAEDGPSLTWREVDGGDALCPYCRDGLLSEGLALERCATCHTVQHAECLNEAGRCAVFGCASGGREQLTLAERV
ncbi:MAG: hypothetical protein R3F62_13715 [Planctomycetota bacterium]